MDQPQRALPITRTLHEEMRTDAERRAWRVTLLLLGAVLLLAAIISLGGALLLVGGLLAASTALVRMKHSAHLGNAVRIGQRQFPDLTLQAARAARAVRAPAIQIYVYQEDEINAYAFGWKAPFAIALTSRMAGCMDGDELRFILGHEMGHILLGHTHLGTITGGLMGAPSVPFVSNLLKLIFSYWGRSAEFSADRAGLAACGQLEKSLSAVLKLMVGPTLAQQVNLGEVLEQANELDRHRDSLAGEVWQAHPYAARRLRELVRCWHSEDFKRLLECNADGALYSNYELNQEEKSHVG